MKPRVVLLSRPGCGLCRAAREVLDREAASGAFVLEEIDITGDDALEREHGLRIPVVLIDGEEVAEIEVDPARFRLALRARTG